MPYPPGALTDVLGRLVGERLNAAFGQPVMIDNKPGAATQLGAAYVAKQPPDGYTLLLATVSTLCITPALYAKPLIAHTDFAGAAMPGQCHPDPGVPARPAGRDPRELVALLRAKPDGYSYGSPGVGTAHHLLAELILSREELHRPCTCPISVRSRPWSILPKAASISCSSTPRWRWRRSRRARSRRSPSPAPAAIRRLPDVPALTEFFPGLDLQPWMSIVAPAGTPEAILDRLNSEINKALGEKAFIERLRQIGVEATPLTVAAFGDFISRDAGRWAELVRISGAKAE